MTLPSEHEFQPALTPEHTASLFLSPDMAEDFRQMSHGEPLTWGATPLNPYLNKKVSEQQFNVSRATERYYMRTFYLEKQGITAGLAAYAYDINNSRISHRVSKNYDSYQYRGVQDDTVLPDWLQESYNNTLIGRATPAEILAVADTLKIPTIELASLTHPYGGNDPEARIKLLVPMRRAVKDAIIYLGGELSTDEPQYQVKRRTTNDEVEKHKMPPTMLMTRSTRVGLLPNDTRIIERSSFLLRLDLLPQSLLEAVNGVVYDAEWKKKTMQLAGFKDYVDSLLTFDNHEAAIPLSTTTFAVNDQLVSLLLNKDRMREISMGKLVRTSLVDAARLLELLEESKTV